MTKLFYILFVSVFCCFLSANAMNFKEKPPKRTRLYPGEKIVAEECASLCDQKKCSDTFMKASVYRGGCEWTCFNFYYQCYTERKDDQKKFYDDREKVYKNRGEFSMEVCQKYCESGQYKGKSSNPKEECLKSCTEE